MSTQRIEALHARLEKVRVLFERYFSGLEKRLPIKAKEEISRDIRRFLPGNDAVQRFKHRNLVQRLIVLEQYWGRITRAIEAGTFHREVARADYRTSKRAGPTDGGSSKSVEPSQGESAEAAAFLSELEPKAEKPKKATPKIQLRGEPKSGKADKGRRPSKRGPKKT